MIPRATIRIALVLALVATLGVADSPTAQAECTGFDGWPSLGTAAPTAKAVYVGTVTKAPDEGATPRFTLDGQSWRRYAVPSQARSDRPPVMDLAVSPEGATWVVVRDLIKFGTSRPDGVYVIDPAQAQPIDTEDARLVEPSATMTPE